MFQNLLHMLHGTEIYIAKINLFTKESIQGFCKEKYEAWKTDESLSIWNERINKKSILIVNIYKKKQIQVAKAKLI